MVPSGKNPLVSNPEVFTPAATLPCCIQAGSPIIFILPLARSLGLYKLSPALAPTSLASDSAPARLSELAAWYVYLVNSRMLLVYFFLNRFKLLSFGSLPLTVML